MNSSKLAIVGGLDGKGPLLKDLASELGYKPFIIEHSTDTKPRQIADELSQLHLSLVILGIADDNLGLSDSLDTISAIKQQIPHSNVVAITRKENFHLVQEKNPNGILLYPPKMDGYKSTLDLYL